MANNPPFIIQGAQALTEDTTRVAGIIAGCVEASALVVSHIIKGTPLNTTELRNLITGAVAARQTSGNSAAGGSQSPSNLLWDLSQFGISARDYYNPGSQSQSLIEQALQNNTPVLIGLRNAMLPNDTFHGGHEIAIVGENSPGNYIVADPNSPQAASGKFTNVTIQDLINSNIQDIAIPGLGGPGVNNIPNSNPSGFNPLDPASWAGAIGQGIQTGIGNVSGQISNDFASAIGTMFKGLGNSLKNVLWAPFAALGLNSANDLFWRILFISIALIIFIIGMTVLFREPIKETATTATMAAAAA